MLCKAFATLKFSGVHVRLWGVIIIFLIIGAICVGCYLSGHRDFAKFVVSLAGVVSVLFAVITALFGDTLRVLVNPLCLQIELPKVVNEFPDDRYDPRPLYTQQSPRPVRKVFMHHLVLREKTGGRIVKDCRVWLTAVRDGDSQPMRAFAVPRLMSWAPSEISPEKRSFGGSQVFDFGYHFVDQDFFEIARFSTQGGRFVHGTQDAPQVRQYVFQIEVDGFVSPQEHVVEVSFVLTPSSDLFPLGRRVSVRVL